MKVIVVAGALANKRGNGGGAWERMSWVIGLKRLGFEVYFVECIEPQLCVNEAKSRTDFFACANLAWFETVTQWFGVHDRSTLVYGNGEETSGLAWTELRDLAESASLLVNLGGHLATPSLLQYFPLRAYVDVDPGFTQFWHVDPDIPFRIPEHELYFTIGENIGESICSIPTGRLPWKPTRQPVVLDDWPVVPSNLCSRFTTIASWRGAFGPVHVNGRNYGLKVHEFRKFSLLPRYSEPVFEIALDIHPADSKDVQLLKSHGWQLTDPAVAAGTPNTFRTYIQQSDAEFSVAQGIYVDTNSGWFSDRTIRYLATGKPALVQDTGFSRNISIGNGLLTFRTTEEAMIGVGRIRENYEEHSAGARTLAEKYFRSENVLERFLDYAQLSA